MVIIIKWEKYITNNKLIIVRFLHQFHKINNFQVKTKQRDNFTLNNNKKIIVKYRDKDQIP